MNEVPKPTPPAPYPNLVKRIAKRIRRWRLGLLQGPGPQQADVLAAIKFPCC